MQTVSETPSSLATSFGEALLRVMRVAGESDEGHHDQLSRVQLAERADVSLTLIKRYLRGDAASAKLETIEKLAGALGVPPAFLLMRREDWVAVANASIVLAQILREDGQNEPDRKFGGRSSINPLEAATAGVEFARLVQALPRRRDFTPPEMAQAIRRSEDGVAHTCATPPLALLTPIQIYATLALCAVVGTTTNC
ncbi:MULTISPECIES: helix-turn-helix domain-containing protein [Rhodanobacter]|uniref:helix-turn-helix domain-containing protein n=1 Tax=Rhodanobacter TaxID=75309 RepID=UPI00131EF930|nr:MULTISPECIES: helix-turn-helix transcriptional regulator [Rhodanobacter]UJJ56838.1 helix-turn-helix transcriptional regulator [Rhodanobacter denitrificans]